IRKHQGLRTTRSSTATKRTKQCDKQYKKAHLGTALKANLLGSILHSKRILLEKVGGKAKQLNSAIRKYEGPADQRWQKTHSFHTNIAENNQVLVAGFGCKEDAVGDIPGIHFKVVKVANVFLQAFCKGKKKRPTS
uniref:Small ribosomal subunit protein uS12 n=1 Tax=Ailuropoda melanoleuca TaxID=9646 RepID=G1MNI3_AILME